MQLISNLPEQPHIYKHMRKHIHTHTHRDTHTHAHTKTRTHTHTNAHTLKVRIVPPGTLTVLTFRWAISGVVGWLVGWLVRGQFSKRTALRIFLIFCTEIDNDKWWTVTGPDFSWKLVNPWIRESFIFGPPKGGPKILRYSKMERLRWYLMFLLLKEGKCGWFCICNLKSLPRDVKAGNKNSTGHFLMA